MSTVKAVKTVKPIRPEEIIEFKKKSIPPQVVQVVNDLLKHKWDGHSAVITKKDIVNKVCEALQCTEEYLYNKHMLDFEALFREHGWCVIYARPGWGDEYDAYFEFTIKN